jgi:hypothetical protein
MAINREGYSSLIESIQEATSMAPSSKGGVSRIRGGRAAATSNTRTGQVQWGDPSIGGAMNASELAAFLASQQGKSSPTPSVADGAGVASVRKAANFTQRSTPAGVKKSTLPFATDAAGVVSGSRAGSFAQSTGGAKKSSSSVAAQRSTSSNNNSWGGSGVFGAKNAEDLARILSQMSYDGPSASTSGKDKMRSRKSSASNRTSSASSSSKPAAKRPATVSVADVQEALDILEELNESKWASGEALSYQLNRMQNSGPSASTGASKGGVRSRGNQLSNRRPGSGTTAPKAPKPTLGGGVDTMSEDWDILDEILAEGIELYGEDGLAEILADFAETGEISDELALLLSDE